MRMKNHYFLLFIPICVALVALPGCKPDPGGTNISLQPGDWPCDTCMVHFALLNTETGKVMDDISYTVMRPGDWPPDTTFWKAVNLIKGKYRLEILVYEVTKGAPQEKALKTWYYSGKSPNDLVETIKDAEIINVTGEEFIVHFDHPK